MRREVRTAAGCLACIGCTRRWTPCCAADGVLLVLGRPRPRGVAGERSAPATFWARFCRAALPPAELCALTTTAELLLMLPRHEEVAPAAALHAWRRRAIILRCRFGFVCVL